MVKSRDDATGSSLYLSMGADRVCRGCFAELRAFPRAPAAELERRPLDGLEAKCELASADPDHHRVFGSARGVWFTLHVGRLC